MSSTPRHSAARQRSSQTLASGMTHSEVLETLSGLLLGLFVSILSSTVVSNALPTIVNELHGSESSYTWVVTATLLATTISTPIWGKLSDLFSKKILVQTALVIFVVSSMCAGLSQNMGTLITTRVFQGLGAGGLTALTQVILATIVSPRERGRYSGYLGATFAVATVAGPLIGGVITEHLSWRWCFYVGVPFAVAALLVLQKTLHLPTERRHGTSIDYLGASLLAGGVSCLLIWVSLAGDHFDWWSWQTGAMVGGGIVLLALTIMAERVAKEPIIPLRLFSKAIIVLASTASLFVGVAMFASTVFLGQYFQLARAETPTKAGVMTIPLVLGLFLSSTVSGQVITRTGRWKAWLVAGGVLLTAGLGLLGTIHYDTNFWVVAIWMAMVGIGLGMMMQNLVVAVQNEVPLRDLGAASSFVAFTRSLGGAIGVSALGALLRTRVKDHLTDALVAHHVNPRAMAGHSTSIPNVKAMKEPLRSLVQDSYGSGVADIFLAAAPFALLALLITLFIRETLLRTRNLEEGEDATAGTTGELAEGATAVEADRAATGHGRHEATRHDTDAAAVGTGEGQDEHAPLRDREDERDTETRAVPAASATTSTVTTAAATRAPGLPGVTTPRTGTSTAPVGETRSPSVSVAERTYAETDTAAGTLWRAFVGTVSRADAASLGGARVTLLDEAGRPLARTVSTSDGRYHLDVPASTAPRRVVVEIEIGEPR